MAADDPKLAAILDGIANAAENLSANHQGCSIGPAPARIAANARTEAARVRSTSGPAQVATAQYRASWDRTFGGKRSVVGQA